MILNINYWIRISLYNLMLVAFLGLVLRYKIGFHFPFLDQKNILHAHSHFAFLGWITHALFVLILHVLIQKGVAINHIKYKQLIIANLICAYSMVFSFLISGYGLISIALSTTSILVNWMFCILLFKDLKQLAKEDYFSNWFKAALLFNVISSLGTFGLAYVIGLHHFNQHWYLASLYFYLHFQYNGFFTFACIGLLIYKLPNWLPNFKYNVEMFWYFFVACLPAYFLSTLWVGLPMWLYVIVAFAAISQLVAWFKILKAIFAAKYNATNEFRKIVYFILLVGVAFTVKLLLQLGSTLPAVSKMAFGFRPIVIAYLHLILLAIISVFLVTYVYANNFISSSPISKYSLISFVVGVYLNELILGIQGIASLYYYQIPHVNEILFLIALLIFVSLFFLLFLQKKIV